MTTRQIAYRLKSEGKAELLRDQREVGQGFRESFGAAEQGAAKAGAAADQLERRYQRLAAAALSSAEAQRTQDRYDALLGVQNSPAPSARDSAAVFMLDDELARRAQQLRDALDPAAAAQSRLNNELKEYQSLATAGKITTSELAQLQAQARVRFDETTAAIQRSERGLSRLAVASRLNLARQGADVFVTAAMGMNPAMIAMQQGPQIADAWSTSNIKLNASLLAIAGSLGLVAGAVGVGAAAWLSGEKSSLAYDKAISGIGRTSQMTAEELKAAAEAGAEAGELSVAMAREWATAYAATGKIGGEVISGLTAITKDYASFAGIEAAAAQTKLATAMGDPAKAAVEMTRQFGLLDQKTIDHIESLDKLGQRTAAQKVLLEALTGAVSGHGEKVGELTSLWDVATRTMSNYWTKLGEALHTTRDERIGKYESAIANARRDNANPEAIRRMESELFVLRQLRDWDATTTAGNGATAARNQAAQEAEDRANAGRSSRARVGRDAERERREALQRMRRDEDRDSQVAIEVAKSFQDMDEVRRLEDEVQLRRRIRELVDEGAEAEAARTKALAEQAPLLEARERNTYREREALTVAASYEVDSLLGNHAALKAREKHLDLVRRIDGYVQQGVEYYHAWRLAAADLEAVEEARAEVAERAADAREREWRMELARASGNRGDFRDAARADWIDRRAAEIERDESLNSGSARAREKASQEYGALMRAETTGAMRDGLKSFVDDIRRGGVGDALAEQFANAADRLIDKLIDGLFDMDWTGLFGGGQGGGGGWFSGFTNFLFGRNAEGTDYWTGGPTWVGERGAELLDLPRGSRVVEHSRSMDLMRRAAGDGTGPQRVLVEVVARKGDQFEPEIVRISGAVARQAASAAFAQSVDTSSKAAPTAVADSRAYKT